MPMVSLPISVEDKININTNEAIGTARFVNLGAVIEYNVYTSNETFADENVIGVTFEASTPIAGNFTVDLTQVSEDAIPSPTGLTENTVYSSLNEPVTVGSSKDNGVKVYQVIAPGTISGIITVTTDAAFYEYTISSMDFNRGKIRPLNVDLASANAVRLTEGERILVGSKWKLADYYESWADDHITDGYNVMQDVGAEDARFTEPRLVFHASGDFRMNHFHFFKDLENTPSSTPQNANGRWALSADNSTLTLSDGAFPISVTAQYPDAVDWTVVTLTSDELHLVTYNEEQWVNLVFVPDGVNDDPQPGVETSWDHTFDTGDFDLTDEYIWADPLTDTFDGMTWTLANNQGAYAINTPWTWSGTVIWNGWGWDYLPTVVTLSSSSFEGTITSVSLDYTVGQHWVFQAGCTVGGDVFGDIELCYNDDGEMPQQTVTFTGLDPASGTIVITITQEGEVHPILLRGVHVVYTPE